MQEWVGVLDDGLVQCRLAHIRHAKRLPMNFILFGMPERIEVARDVQVRR